MTSPSRNQGIRPNPANSQISPILRSSQARPLKAVAAKWPQTIKALSALYCLFLLLPPLASAFEFDGLLKGVTITDPAVPNLPPTAVINFSQEGNTASFDASASTDADGQITSYRWDFGDGATATGVTASHLFSAGNYAVTLAVVDNQGAVALAQVNLNNLQVIEFGAADTCDQCNTIADTFTNLSNTINEGKQQLSTWNWSSSKPNEVANTIILKADLSSIPASATITEARLYLNQVGFDPRNPVDTTNTVHKIVGKNPVISQVTGTNASNIEPWSPVPGRSRPEPLGLGDIAPAEDSIVLDTSPGWKSWNVTRMVQEWVSNPATNNGLLVSAESSTAKELGRIFAATESTDPTKRPKLIVSYY